MNVPNVSNPDPPVAAPKAAFVANPPMSKNVFFTKSHAAIISPPAPATASHARTPVKICVEVNFMKSSVYSSLNLPRLVFFAPLSVYALRRLSAENLCCFPAGVCHTQPPSSSYMCSSATAAYTARSRCCGVSSWDLLYFASFLKTSIKFSNAFCILSPVRYRSFSFSFRCSEEKPPHSRILVNVGFIWDLKSIKPANIAGASRAVVVGGCIHGSASSSLICVSACLRNFWSSIMHFMLC